MENVTREKERYEEREREKESREERERVGEKGCVVGLT